MRRQANRNIGLPRAYLDFMRYAGGGAFWVGSDYGFDKVPLLLKPDDFVFLMHQGYRFCFFSLSAGDDPPVFCFSEEYDKPEFVRLSDSFTDFITRPYRPDAPAR